MDYQITILKFSQVCMQNSIFVKPTKCTNYNSTKHVTKHASYQIPTPICLRHSGAMFVDLCILEYSRTVTF